MKSLAVVLALALFGSSIGAAEAQVFRGDSLTRRRAAPAKPAKARPARAKQTARPAPRKAPPPPKAAPKGKDEVIVIIEDE